jgi:hypothetical protein
VTTPNVVNFLANSAGTDELALARKIYETNFNEAFRQQSKIAASTLPIIDRRSVSGSSSFQFYMFGETPEPEKEYISGDELRGQDYAVESDTVAVDDIIVAHKALGLKDYTISHLNVLPQLGRENARTVSVELDRRLLNMHAQAARASAVTKNGLTIHNGGNRVMAPGNSSTLATALTNRYPKSATGTSNLRSDLRDLGYLMDQDQVPEEGRMIIMDSYLRQVLLAGASDTAALVSASTTLFSRDFTDGQNKVQSRQIMEIEGFKVMFFTTRVSQGGLLPDTNVSAYTRATKFNANFTPGASNGTPVVLAFCGMSEDTAAVGFGTWLGLTSDIDYNKRNFTWLAETHCLTGIDQMRPWCAGSIEVGSASSY